MKPELHLFILWEKARRVESRILEDLARQKDIAVVGKWELSFPGPAAEAFPAFYGRRNANAAAGLFCWSWCAT